MGSPYIVNGKTDAERYLEAIQRGDIVANVYMRKLADMMLPRFHEPYKNFHFDVQKSLRGVQFIERFTCYPEGEKQGQPFILDQWQRAVMEMAFGFVDEHGYRQFRQVILEVARKNGKALTVDTEIPTPDGWRLMRDIHPGDYVFGQDGKPSKVLVESEIFDKPMYLVTFEDGSTIKASADHIWTVRCNDDEPWRDLTTEEIAETLGHRLYCVPACEPVRYEEKEYDVSPYAYAVEHCDEQIPNEYLQGSVMQRMAYLSGLFDGCGSEKASWNVAWLHFSELNAVESCMELLASLGYTHNTLREHLGSWNYVIEFWPTSFGNVKWITGVKRIPNEPSKCIAIDNDSHLYLVGRQYTATHNSSWMAALALYFLTSDNEPGAEVLCIANSEQQAKRVFGHADTMRRRSPALKDRIRRGMSQKRGVSGLNYDKNDSILVSVPANVGTADGYSASAYIYDELAAATDMGAMLSAIEESVSGRRQATGWIISSENHVRYNVWDDKIDYARNILAGKIEDDTVLPVLYCLDQGDSFTDSSVYIKANPGLLSGIKSMRYMEDRANAATNSPQVKTSFMTKDLCLRVNSYTSFLSEYECINTETFVPNPVTDRYCCVGFDLSDRGDLTACVAAFMRPGDDRIYEYSHAWIPETQVEINSARDLKQRDGVPYNVWASGDDPWMTIVQGDKVDHHVAILGFIDELAEKGLYTRYVAFDPWHVDDYLLRELHMRIGKDNCIPVRQNTKVLSPLMKEHKIDLAAHRIVNPSPVLAWNRSSVQSKIDAAGNVYPNKKELKPQNKIDMYMAELFAYKMIAVDFSGDYKQLIGWTPPEAASR